MKNRNIFICFLIAGFASCGPAYQIRKTDKANHKLYVSATTNEVVAPMVASDYNLKHPIDQKPIYIKGKDSVRIDSIPYDVVRDSLIKIECPTVNFDSLRKVWTKTIYHNTVDTLQVLDTNCLRRLNLQLTNYSQLQGKNLQMVEDNAQLNKSKGKVTLWLVGVSIAFLLVLLAIVYNFIKPKAKL